MTPLRVLIANVTLAGRTGTETVVRDLALGLRRIGHEPMVYSPRLGEIATEIARAGIPVCADLNDVPAEPDIVHGNHHVELVSALLKFPRARGLFVCHDRTAYWSAPPRMSRVLTYVAVDLYCLSRLTEDYGIPVELTRVIHNTVDTARFPERPPLPPRPRRAAVFSHYAGRGTHLEPVRAACDQAGLSLDVIGDKSGNPSSAPEDVLGAYDIVFAKARCALEAMAVGAAVVLCDAQGLGGMVTSHTLPRVRPWNFGHRTLRHALDPGAIVLEIEKYDAADALAVSRDIRQHANLSVGTDAYVKLYDELVQAPSPPVVSLERDLDDYLRNSVARVDGLFAELAAWRKPYRMEALSEASASQATLHISASPAEVPRGRPFKVHVTLQNCGKLTLASHLPFPVLLSSRWFDAGIGTPIGGDQPRTDLRPSLEPGASGTYEVGVVSPDTPGTFELRLTLVQERVLWFDAIDRPVAAQVAITVR